METKRKSRFWKGLGIYTLVMLVVIAVGLALFWKFIAAYEGSRTEGVMDTYMEQTLASDVEAAVAAFARDNATPIQSEDAIRTALTEKLAQQTLNCRKATVSTEEPVYTIRTGRTPIGTLTLLEQPEGGLLSFGFRAWAADTPDFDFTPLAGSMTILAPAEAEVLANGAPIDPALGVPGGVHPDLQDFADDLAEAGGMTTYTLTGLYAPVDITARDEMGNSYLVETGEDGVTSVSIRFPVDLQAELEDYAAAFVRAYIGYTSNATGGPGAVQAYMIPGSTLYDRMTAAMVGMVWVHGVTSTMSDLTLDNFRYYGRAALCEAHYTLTTDTGDSDNDMRILLLETPSGWRVANMKLF